MADYIIKNGERLLLVESDPAEGETTYEAEQLLTPTEREAAIEVQKDELAQDLADRLVEGQAADWALARMIFEILKAQRTDDWSYFADINSAKDYKSFLKDLIRSRL